ncbi:winged helix-turn-helix domain-containing protein [Natrarchaeobius oligotrophus]|uniref:Winged helix-turn-helix domain-containing protein n=1 Tax=Natrarchaeobius chitinivorans TaxID=1679083 RepID=A0A3N6M0Y2_NATCH|nr:winged helix-turn-helix domain-containing protein [Natrarchaeobius chitinivorans]RQG96948.1 winged helix-turn-helix domain-containing protein [Natrarchaeobius chitinivorans]
MSDSSLSSGQRRDNGVSAPRAVVHKKILDAAESRPGATMEELAETVSGATIEIVEKVLNEYGDPASAEPEDGATTETENATAAETENEGAVGTETPATDERERDGDGTDHAEEESPQSATVGDHRAGESESPSAEAVAERIEPSDVTEKQLETLREIRAHPTATQAELADNLGVTSATISQRVNGIDGFDWSERRRIVSALFDGDSGFARDERTVERDADNVRPVAANGASPELEDDRSDSTADGTELGSVDDDDGPDSGDDDAESDSVDGFDRTERTADADETAPTAGAIDDSLGEVSEELTRMTRRLEALEETIAADPTGGDRASSGRAEIPTDPELVHMILRACLGADHVTEDDERRIVAALLASEGESP